MLRPWITHSNLQMELKLHLKLKILFICVNAFIVAQTLQKHNIGLIEVFIYHIA